jgi:hypothetical protein
MGTKIYLPTFLVAIAIPIALAIVSGSVGIHSTPGIRLVIAGLPGTIVGAGTVLVFGDNNPLFYVTTALANWAFYLSVAKGVILLKGKIQGIRHKLPRM